MFESVNYLSVFLAGVASMVVGFLWYSPMLFGNHWARAMGWDLTDSAKMAEMKKGAGKSYAWSFVGSLVMAYVLAVFLGVAGGDVWQGLCVAFWLWLGFVATVKFSDFLFSDKNVALFFINSGYQLASILAMALVIGWWG